MTATVTVVTTAGLTKKNSDLYRFLANIASVSAGQPGSFTGNNKRDQVKVKFTSDSSDFTYDSGGIAGGTITGLTLIYHGVKIMTVAFAPGLSLLGVKSAADAFFASHYTDPTQLDAIFASLPYDFTGNTGPDRFGGGAGEDILQGGDGNDVLLGTPGADLLDGGAGINTLSYANDTVGVLVNLPASSVGNNGGSGSDAEGDTVVFSTFQNLIGGHGNDFLTGSSGNNRISGGDGDDIIAGGLGKDILIGGGNTAAGDTVDFGIATLTAGVSVSLGKSKPQNTGAGIKTITGFENLTGSDLNDVLTGNNGANIIIGSGGDDLIEGRGGNDTLEGGGNGAGGDTVSYAHAKAGVTVSLNFNATGGDGTDSLFGFENIIGSSKADTLTGSFSEDNVIEGGAGNDTLDGLSDGPNGDTVSYAHAAAAVKVSLATGTATGGAGKDTLVDFENILGSNFADKLTGDDNANTLTGGRGADILTGGLGADNFAFRSLKEKGDHITDFGNGADTIRIDHAGFANTVAGVTNFTSDATPVASNGDAWFLYDTDDGKLFFDADGNGSGAKVLLVTLDGHPPLTALDIVIV